MVRRRQEFFRIFSWRRTYDREAGRFTFNISYETVAPEPSERVVTVAEAFGLGLDKWEKFVLYDNVELKIRPTDIVYLTGDSGSGKSVLLKAILENLGDEAADINDVRLEPSKPLIETVGRTVEEGLEMLSRVGLNDAFLFFEATSNLATGRNTVTAWRSCLKAGSNGGSWTSLLQLSIETLQKSWLIICRRLAEKKAEP